MQHVSALVGPFQYRESQVITFPEGLSGYEDCTQFVLKRSRKMAPICFLLSVEEDGPDFALVDPGKISPAYAPGKMRFEPDILKELAVHSAEDLRMFAVVTIPEDTARMSMNLQLPILMNPGAKLGMQLAEPGLPHQPAVRRIYREITGGNDRSESGSLLILRKLGESIQIGDDITVEVMQFADGGVRLGVRAPKDLPITRSAGGAARANQLAAQRICLQGLEQAMQSEDASAAV